MKKKSSESVVKEKSGELLAGIGSGDGRHIARLYDLYRSEFIGFARRSFSLGETEAVEIYQESFIALYENIRRGRLTRLSASLKTYLFRIARNKILNARRGAAAKSQELPGGVPDIDTDDWAERQEIVFSTVQQMQEPCTTVLTLYYWERRSMDEIARALNYAGAQVAKNRKLACMRKLKAILTAKFTAEGFL